MDVILIANEMVDEKIHLGEEVVVLKIDFEKAYEYVNWGFLVSVRREMGLVQDGGLG